MPDEENPTSDEVSPLEPRTVKLPETPTFEKYPTVKEEEHKRWPKPQGPYRRIEDLGEPSRVEETSGDSPEPKH
jgi:hypothetical protein